MKVLVFGAAGRTGRNIVDQALNRGYQVTAFIHKTRGIEKDVEKGLQAVQGDVLNFGDVERAVAGHDAVLSALGRGSSRRQVTFPGTKNIVEAMEKLGVRRLIVESAFGAGESAKEMSFLDRFLVRGVLLRSSFRDKDMMEGYVEKSGLEWTIVRPPRLTDGPRRGRYRAGERIPLNIRSGMSREDAADFMLEQVEGKEFINKKPSVGY
ncbi:MAG TPA: SDR family oxidoreductase [Nitrososphaerales archaeon]|nr:SDR family oxidoreductase [Nitrososphaerales archaeon]